MMEYKNIARVFEAHKNESPEEILEAIQSFFYTAGEYCRDGLITEEEFYSATFYADIDCDGRVLYQHLWGLKNQIHVYEYMWNDPEFRQSWKQWKRSGTFQIKPWMLSSIDAAGKPEETVDWIFSVIDGCKIPMHYMDHRLTELRPDKPPQVAFHQERDTIETLLFAQCYNMQTLTNDPAPERKHFVLRFEGNLEADLTVNRVIEDEHRGRRYRCYGTVTDYVLKPQSIEICYRKGYPPEVIINKKTNTPWKVTAMTEFAPIQHPKWELYNTLFMESRLFWEAEYKALRIPFILGTEEKTPIKKPAVQSTENSNIIRLFNG